MTVHRIPKYITLPFGYRITVIQLTDRDYDEENGPDSFACWDSSDRTMYLRKRRPIRKRRADLAHEMLHACTDWQVWLLATNQVDVKA